MFEERQWSFADVNTRHHRTESISTTASELEFRSKYQARTKKLIHRQCSQQTYQRMSERFYGEVLVWDHFARAVSLAHMDNKQRKGCSLVLLEFTDNERTVLLEKIKMDSTFGFHITSSAPVVISTVEPGELGLLVPAMDTSFAFSMALRVEKRA